MLLWSSTVFGIWQIIEQCGKRGWGHMFSVNEGTAPTSNDAEFFVSLDSQSPLKLWFVTGLDKLRRRKLKQLLSEMQSSSDSCASQTAAFEYP
jgi:hypothetical protein